MLIHGASSLRGPITQSRVCWRCRGQNAVQDRPIRKDLVARIKAEIAAGTYDTPERFEAAFAKLLNQHNLA